MSQADQELVEVPGPTALGGGWPAVRAHGHAVVRDAITAVAGVSFVAPDGRITGLLGPNGAGKSTTFNLITGVLSLTRGAVQFRGQAVGGLPSREIARAGMSRTFQHVKLVPDMTVLDNVALGTYLRTRSGTLQAMLGLNAAEEAQARLLAAHLE